LGSEAPKKTKKKTKPIEDSLAELSVEDNTTAETDAPSEEPEAAKPKKGGKKGKKDDEEKTEKKKKGKARKEEDAEDEDSKPKGKGKKPKAKRKDSDDGEDDGGVVFEKEKKKPAVDKPAIGIRGLIQILPHLYLGNADSSTEKEELLDQGIKYIINCASEDVQDSFKEDFVYKDFPLNDTHEARPCDYWEEAADIILQAKEEDVSVLVHCIDGKSISGAMILAYMMLSAKRKEKELSLLEALDFMLGKEPGAIPSDTFMEQLIKLEKDLFETNTVQLTNKKSGAAGARAQKGGKPSLRGAGGRGGKGRRGK